MESTQVKQSVSRSSIYKARMTARKYVFDTPTFILLQSYLEDFGYEIIDIPHSKLLRERCKALGVIANALRLKMCYVTESVMKEVLAEEEKGKLWNGTSQFIKQHFGIIDNERELAVEKDLRGLLNKSDDARLYEVRQYKLVWDSMKLVGGNTDVFILTPDDKLSDLGIANELIVMSLWNVGTFA